MNWNNEKTWKVVKGAGLAGVGALLTYVVAYVGNLDLGVYGPVVAGLLAVAANAVRQMIADNDASLNSSK